MNAAAKRELVLRTRGDWPVPVELVAKRAGVDPLFAASVICESKNETVKALPEKVATVVESCPNGSSLVVATETQAREVSNVEPERRNEDKLVGEETDLQRKIRISLKKHKQRPGVSPRGQYNAMVPHKGIRRQYLAVAAEVGCSFGAVQAVEQVDRAFKIGEEQREQRLVPLPFDVPVTADVGQLVKDFPGWIVCFGKLSLLINSYLQIARVTGASMPAAWLTSLREICETAQTRSEQDRDLKKLWPNGAPAGSGHFAECKAIEHT